MKDLTHGSIASHIDMALDCRWHDHDHDLLAICISFRAGDAAVAAWRPPAVRSSHQRGCAGAGIGTVALISHAVGRRIGPTPICVQPVARPHGGGVTWLGSVLAAATCGLLPTEAVEAGTTYLLWFMPALGEFAMQVMASALRATGIVRPSMIVQALAVIINIALAPVLIAGWGTGRAFGVAGAGLASSVAVLIGVLMLWRYFHKLERYVSVDPAQWRPQAREWKRILYVGLPAGGEFAIIFIWMAVIYYALRDFGAAAQAGFGIGTRVLGLIQMPALAIALAAGPIAGQNFGAGNGARVRETFTKAALIGTAVMIAFTIFAQWKPNWLLGGFASDPETMAVAALFLRIVSLNLVAQGLIFACSSVFQGLGNTTPVLLSSAARLVTYAAPIIWLSTRPGFRIEQVWYLSIATTTLQAGLSLWLLRREFRKRVEPLVH